MKRIFLLALLVAGLSYGADFSTYAAAGWQPVMVPPGQTLDNLIVPPNTLTNGGATINGYGITNGSSFTLVTTNDPRYLATVTNNQTSVTLGLAIGTTVADATQTNHPVSLAQLEAAVNGLLTTPYYGATNQHPVLGSGYASFHGDIPVNQWTNSYVLGTTYALVGNRFSTNITAGGTVIPALSSFDHHVYASVSAVNGGMYYSRVVFVKSDRTETQQVCLGAVVEPDLTIRELVSGSSSPTNITLGSGSWYLGVERYTKKAVGGVAVTLNIYGGDGTPTRLEVPSSLSPSGTFATRQYVDAQNSAHTNQTLAAGAHGGVVPINILSNAPNATWKIYGTQVVETANNWAIIDATQPLRLYSWGGTTEDQGGVFVRTDTKSLFIDFDARTFHNINGDKRLAVSGSTLSSLELYDPYNQLAMKGKPSGGGGFEFLKPITLGGVELSTFSGIAGAIAHTNIALADGAHSDGAALVSSVAAANSTGATHTAQIASNASPYQPWTTTLTPPPSDGTNVLKFSDGALPFLSCTGAQTVAWIDGNANGWGTAGVNRQRLAIWKDGFSVTIQSNASVVHASTITLSSTKTNHIVANITVGSGYTNVVLYPLQAQ